MGILVENLFNPEHGNWEMIDKLLMPLVNVGIDPT